MEKREVIVNLLHWLKAKYDRSIGKRRTKTVRRRQFNMTVAEEIVLGVKLLAAILKVPRHVITEHLLQVGSYYTLTAIKDEDKRRTLEEHLVKEHLLGDELSDDEDILRLGQ